MQPEDRIEKQNEERDRIETEKERAIEVRDWGKTVLIWLACIALASIAFVSVTFAVCTIKYGVPAIKEWQASNRTTAEQVPKIVENVASLVETGNTQLARVGPAVDKVGQLTDGVRTGPVAALTRSTDQLTSLEKQIGEQARNGGIRASIMADEASRTINASTGSLNELTELERKFGLTADQTTDGVKKAGLSVDQFTELLKSTNPNIQRVLTALADDEVKVGDLVGSLDDDAKAFLVSINKFSTLVELFNQYVATANKWHKWVLLAQIINLLSGLPRP